MTDNLCPLLGTACCGLRCKWWCAQDEECSVILIARARADRSEADPVDQLWTDKDIAKFLQVSEEKVRQDRLNNKLPFRVIRFGRTVRYDPSEVKNLMAGESWQKQ